MSGEIFDRNETTAQKNDDVNYYPNSQTSIWLRSCDEEVIEPITGEIHGVIPEWLSGALLRNGPGKLKIGEDEFNHLFDGSAMLQRFYVSAGKVTYQRRFIQTETYRKNHQAKRIVLSEFGTKAVPDPCQTIFNRISAVFDPDARVSDNTLISIYPLGDEYYTFTDAPFIHRIDHKTLETKDRIRISDYIGVVNHSSHPHITEDGAVYNLGLSITPWGPVHKIVCFPSIPKDKRDESNDKIMFEKAKIVASLPARWKLNPSYMHTFGITENYFILIEQPFAVAVISIMACQFANEPVAPALKWHDNENTLIHVLSRATGALIKTFTATSLFYLHIINQYESKNGDNVVIDLCCHSDAEVLNCMYVDALKNMKNNPDYAKLFRAKPTRFVLPMTEKLSDVDGTISVEPELICNVRCEMPRFNLKYLGKEYRYFYAMSSDLGRGNPGAIIKVDTLNKSSLTWSEDGLYPSEPVFVPHPESQSEDDGVILTAVVYENARESDVSLVILDAKSMEEIGRATFHTPGIVPKCLHGWFAPENSFQ